MKKRLAMQRRALHSVAVVLAVACSDPPDPGAPTTGSYVASREARACELYVSDGSLGVPYFPVGVRGATLRRGSDLVISFVSTADERLPSPAVRFMPSGGVGSSSERRSISACYDRLGAPLRDASVTIVGL